MLLIDVTSAWFTELTAQLAHFFAALAIVENIALFGYPWIGLFAMIGFAAIKEFVFDKYVENQPLEANVKDFCFYLVGSITGLALLI